MMGLAAPDHFYQHLTGPAQSGTRCRDASALHAGHWFSMMCQQDQPWTLKHLRLPFHRSVYPWFQKQTLHTSGATWFG